MNSDSPPALMWRAEVDPVVQVLNKDKVQNLQYQQQTRQAFIIPLSLQLSLPEQVSFSLGTCFHFRIAIIGLHSFFLNLKMDLNTNFLGEQTSPFENWAHGKRRGFNPGATARHSQSARVNTDFFPPQTIFSPVIMISGHRSVCVRVSGSAT